MQISGNFAEPFPSGRRLNVPGEFMKTLACTLMLAPYAFTALAADATGKWAGSFTPEGQDASTGMLILKQSGTEITGTGGPNAEQQYPVANGKIDGNKVTLDLQHP